MQKIFLTLFVVAIYINIYDIYMCTNCIFSKARNILHVKFFNIFLNISTFYEL